MNKKTFDDWSEYLYNLLFEKINNKFNIDKTFIYNKIYSNKNFNLNFFNKDSELKIDYELLSYNPNITFEYIVENKYFLWNDKILNKILGKNINNYFLYKKYYNDICKFYKFDILYEIYESWENILFIEKNFNYKIRYEILSMNKNISWELIINNIDRDWNFEYLVMYNENITIDIVINNKKYFNDKCIKLLSKNKSIKWYDIDKYKDQIEWNYKDLSLNPNITIEIVLNNLDKKWCFHRLSSNPNINIDIILQYNQFNWSIYWYSFNPNIQLNDIDKINITNEIFNQDIIIKNLFLNNYDFDRNKYFEINEIKINDNLNKILENNNFELIIY